MNKSSKNKQSLALVIVIYLAFLFANLNITYLNNDSLKILNPCCGSINSSTNYNYHQFTQQIIKVLPNNLKINILINSVPDPYFDLKDNPNYYLTQPAIYISEENYHKLLDTTDYVIANWIPNQIIADYINSNTDSRVLIGKPNSYQTLVIKLTPKNKRKQN